MSRRAAWAAATVGLLAACSGRALSGPDEGPPPAGPGEPVYTPGQSYHGRNRYVEYIAGNAPVILTAPHGGDLAPAEIPDRTCGTTTGDRNTEQLARSMQAAFFRQTGRYPHVVINRLRRLKLDANRERAEATCGSAAADTAWHEYHAYVDAARRAVLATEGKGWYLDLHGHGHPAQRLELGYLLDPAQLARSDAELDADPAAESASSIGVISREAAGVSFSALLRGPASLGTLYAAEGFPAVPSAADPSPGESPYFSGGYSTERHACAGGSGRICGVQLEANLTGVRDTEENRVRFAEATVRVLARYLGSHYGIRLTGTATPP